ncbi:hypothetical protein CRG98_020918 [Punica granatum]|uniref:Tf2-1-like SH3-like domain-containing protein n=1 Tax=Punica granatum TaxID=22663 RepID=A0A2I0JQV9_PUNGR|nr:hypothetical protein CRG98_020918 [Punica granatum]
MTIRGRILSTQRRMMRQKTWYRRLYFRYSCANQRVCDGYPRCTLRPLVSKMLLTEGEVGIKGVADRRRRHVKFEVGDFVWAILTKDRFSAGNYHKLAARKIGPVEIVEKINSNAYRLKLPSDIRTADVFNVKHLIPYTGDSSDDDDSRTNSLHPGENDAAEDLDRFSAGNYHKLAARKIGPVEIVEKINSNAYRLKLPSDIRTADVFNVKHLIPYTGDSSDDDDSRTNSLHPGENDAAEDLDRFSAGNYHKLAARKIGPVEIVEKINSNAYRLKLPSDIRTADVFNVKHLIPYTGDSSDDDDSRTNSLHPGENDAAEDLDRFSAGNYHKLAARKIGPVEIVEKINSNAYRLKLPSDIRTADVFNVKHLIPYTGDSTDDDDSRTNSLHPGENDAAEELASRYQEKNRF